jgi:hypothetical protein
MQEEHAIENNLPWKQNLSETKMEAMIMFDRMFNMKFLPPGRGLWAMGSPLTTEKKLYGMIAL